MPSFYGNDERSSPCSSREVVNRPKKRDSFTFSTSSRHSALSTQSISAQSMPSLYGERGGVAGKKDPAHSNATRSPSHSEAWLLFQAHELVVFELLQGEDVLVEVLLKLLVGKVDVELFEPVDLHKGTHTQKIRGSRKKKSGATYFLKLTVEKPMEMGWHGNSTAIYPKIVVVKKILDLLKTPKI